MCNYFNVCDKWEENVIAVHDVHGTLLQNGLLSALPYLVMWLLSFVFGWASDFMNKRHLISLGTSRKLFNSIGTFNCSCHKSHDIGSKFVTFSREIIFPLSFWMTHISMYRATAMIWCRYLSSLQDIYGHISLILMFFIEV
jgi:hypothetical protein